MPTKASPSCCPPTWSPTGLFWGAPLVTRELEAGTFRLAWNQSVARTRWMAVKLAAVGLAAMLTAGLLSLMLTWWSGPVDTALALKSGNSISFIRVGPVLFAVRGIAPVGYAAFAFVLGVTAGVLVRGLTLRLPTTATPGSPTGTCT